MNYKDYTATMKEIVLKQLALLQDAVEKADTNDLIKVSDGLSEAINGLSYEFFERL